MAYILRELLLNIAQLSVARQERWKTLDEIYKMQYDSYSVQL